MLVLLIMREMVWYIILVAYVFYVYVCNTITFGSLDTGSSLSHIRYISRGYVSSSYNKVIRLYGGSNGVIAIFVT